jgi:ribosomal protein S18 acetylase RimI-like enzyme
LVGFAQLLRHADDHFPYEGHWLVNLRVTPWYRGMGIGEELSRRVIQGAKEQGAKELLLIVTEDNRAAVGLYRKLGFERALIPRLEEHLERERQTTGLKRIVMRKALPSP